MLAHLCSLALTALLCLPLLGRYYDLRPAAPRADPARALARNLLGSGFGLLPANLARRAADRRAAGGAQPDAARRARRRRRRPVRDRAQALDRAARSSARPSNMCSGRSSSAQAHVDRAQIAPLYHFASRVSTALVVPLAGLLVFAGADILSRLPARGDGGLAAALDPGRRARRSRRSSARPRPSSR